MRAYNFIAYEGVTYIRGLTISLLVSHLIGPALIYLWSCLLNSILTDRLVFESFIFGI